MTDDYMDRDLCVVGGTDVIDQQMKQLRTFSSGEETLFPIQKKMLDQMIDGTWVNESVFAEMQERAFWAGRSGKMAPAYHDLYQLLNSDPVSDTFHFRDDVPLENSVSLAALNATGILDDAPAQSTVWFNGDQFFFRTIDRDDTKYLVHVKSEADFMAVVRKIKKHERVYKSSNGTVFTVYG